MSQEWTPEREAQFKLDRADRAAAANDLYQLFETHCDGLKLAPQYMQYVLENAQAFATVFARFAKADQ